MVAVKHHEADRFIARGGANIFLYLVFGTDPGLVAERVRRIIAGAIDDPGDPFQLLRMDGDDLAADPLRLADEANTIPLFGGRRAVWIDAQGKAFLTAVEPVLNAPPDGCVIVIAAGALKKDSALRKLCERDKNAAAIECYPDNAEDIERLIDAEAAAAGLSIAPDARLVLASMLGQDRGSTRSELAKLILFAHGEGRIRLDHVEAIVSDASRLILDNAVNEAFQGDHAALEAGARRVFKESTDPGQLLGAALRHAVGLHRARLDIESGETARADARSFPAGGYGRTKDFERHLRIWNSGRLARVIENVAAAISQTRREPKLAEAIALRALWTVAMNAKARNPAR
jgi:DNA polymerase-3 subunit delta